MRAIQSQQKTPHPLWDFPKLGDSMVDFHAFLPWCTALFAGGHDAMGKMYKITGHSSTLGGRFFPSLLPLPSSLFL